MLVKFSVKLDALFDIESRLGIESTTEPNPKLLRPPNIEPTGPVRFSKVPSLVFFCVLSLSFD